MRLAVRPIDIMTQKLLRKYSTATLPRHHVVPVPDLADAGRGVCGRDLLFSFSSLLRELSLPAFPSGKLNFYWIKQIDLSDLKATF